MPCQSDYLQASGQEQESQRVCKLLRYLYGKINRKVPGWVDEAADDYYGNVRRLDEATMMLCDTLRSLTKNDVEKYVYEAHNKMSRKLANWWERHQEWDKRRVSEEKSTRRKALLRKRALLKLTIEEMEALGIEKRQKGER